MASARENNGKDDEVGAEMTYIIGRDPQSEGLIRSALARIKGGSTISVTIMGTTQTGLIAELALRALLARAEQDGRKVSCTVDGANGYVIGYATE